MPKLIYYFASETAICTYFELTKTEFKQAMTHYTAPNKNNGNRFVFLANFVFKGMLADFIYTYINGTGMQLQHFLGNIFSNNRLAELYDEWRLHRFVIYGEGCRPESQKHVFTLSFIGCLMECAPPRKVEKLMMEFFIYPNNHLLPRVHFPKDDKQKLIFLCKQNDWEKPEIKYTLQQDGKHHFKIALSYGIIESASVSYRYAKKKAFKKALDAAAKILEERLVKTETHQRLELEKYDKEEAERLAKLQSKQEAWTAKQEEKRKEREKRKEERRRAAKLRDEERRKAKEESKKKKASRKGQNTIYRDYTAEEIAAMSSAKRRMLEDKGILPKR